MNLQIQSNLREFGRTLEVYREQTGKAPEEVLGRQGRNFLFYLRAELQDLKPEKGSIKAEALSRLKGRGGGVRVRPSVELAVAAKFRASSSISDRAIRIGRGKTQKGFVKSGGRRLNLRALQVRAELGVRERARGFLRQGARFTRELEQAGDAAYSSSRFNQILGLGEFHKIDSGARLTFSWGETGPLSLKIGGGLTSPAGEAAVSVALRRTIDDILGYLKRKFSKRGFPAP